ncbi:MAG: DUF805 domain-containing protein [Massilia sp.]|nr:DUF805 domain-containing protein [Massilia sp.]
MSSETFEQVLSAAQADGSFTPAWKKFVKTKFFVPVIRADKDLQSFVLRMSDIMGDGKQSILISELRERVEQHHGASLATLYGADVVRMVHAEASILVALSDRAFNIAKERVEWLKNGIEASHARAAAKAAGTDAPVAIAKASPAPAPLPPRASAPAADPDPAPKPTATTAFAPASPRRARGILDIAALKPRSISMPKIGLELFVPAAWSERGTAKGLRFVDDNTEAVIEASGLHRAGVPIAQWLGMRLELVRHEMGYLRRDGASYGLDGEGWRQRIEGMAAEFTGVFPGDDYESRYLVACFCNDGTVASITIKARAESFEQERALYQWLLSRVDINESSSVYQGPGRAAHYGAQDDAAPRVFGLSGAGRIGRARALAYSFPVMLALAGIGLVAALMGPTSPLAVGVALVMAAVVTFWFSLRLMVLRLHDVNLSGRWILGFVALMGVAGALQKPLIIIVASICFWFASLVIYCLVPGTADDNNYGPPPPPNTPLVKLGAVLFFLLQLAGIGLALKSPGLVRAPAAAVAAAQAGDAQRDPNAVAWTSPDGVLSIAFPAQPTEIELPRVVRENLGGVRMHQYKATVQGRTFMVQTVDYGKTSANSIGTLEGMALSIVGRDGVQVSEDRSLRYNGHEAREVRASIAGSLVRSARFVIVGPRVYMAMAVTRDDPAAMRRVDEFLGSLKLAGPDSK